MLLMAKAAPPQSPGGAKASRQYLAEVARGNPDGAADIPNNAIAGQRRAEDLGIAVDLIVRSVPAIDDLVLALEGAGGCARLVRALRAELARRRGRR